MTTYTLYKYRESGLGFVVTDEEESNYNAKHLTDLRESLQSGEVKFEEVFDSKGSLKSYVRDNSIELMDKSQID